LAVAAGAGLAWTIVRRKRRVAAAGISEVESVDVDSSPDDGEPRLTEAERLEIQREVDQLDTDE
jgi:hypothetical protein